MNNVMVDIETIGNQPGAVVLSIGAVYFTFGDDRRLGEEFYANIDVESSLRVGCHIESPTFYWWLRQGHDARRSLAWPTPMPVWECLKSFREYLADGVLVWAKPPNFDLSLLDSVYRKLDQPRPWHYRNERCVRTHLHLAQQLGWSPSDKIKSKTKHNALDDARAQVWTIHSADKWLKDNKED